jgi:TatD DNase family protein
LPRDLAPPPKSRRNEPAHLPHIARALAALRGESPETLAADTTRNALRFFALDASLGGGHGAAAGGGVG